MLLLRQIILRIVLEKLEKRTMRRMVLIIEAIKETK
jgi:hypothetical protein